MKVNELKTRILITITIAVFVVTIIGATYAYFLSSTRVAGAVELGVRTASQSSFTSSTDGDLAFKISIVDMDESKVSEKYIANATATLKVDLSSAEEKGLTICDYDIVWTWDGKDRYTLYDIKLPYEEEGKTYPYEFSIQVGDDVERDLSSLDWNDDGKAILVSKTIEVGPKGNASDTYEISAKMYNIPVEQKNLFNKDFKAHIQVENVSCVTVYDVGLTYFVYNKDDDTSTEVATIPRGDYKLNTDKTSCKRGGTVTDYNTITGELTSNISAGDECEIYFTELEKIIASGQNVASSYDGNAKKISVNVSNVSDYEVYYSLDEELTRENYQEGSKTNPEISDRGTTTVYWCAAKNDYATYCSNNSITIADGIMSGTSSDYAGTYDGNNHSITVDISSPSNATLYYSTTTELTKDNYSSQGSKENPTRSTSGTSIVYWCATADNNTPLCESNRITINPATMAATGQDYTGTYDGDNHNISVSVTKPASGSKIYYSTTTQLTPSNYTSGSTTNPTRSAENEITTVYWCAVADNYTPICRSNNIKINGIMSVTSQGYSGTYTGQYHSITVSVNTPTEGAIIYYSTDKQLTESNYTRGNTTNPAISSVGTTTVYWCATAENYTPLCGSNNITIEKGVIAGNYSDYSGYYNAAPHSINISPYLNGNSYSTYYSTSTVLTEENYLTSGETTKPTRTTPSTTTVYYCVTADNYTTKCGSNKITINNNQFNARYNTSSIQPCYDGNSHEFKLDSVTSIYGGSSVYSDYQVYYSTEKLDSSNYTSGSTTPLKRTEPGSQTIYYCVVGDYYNTLCSSFPSNIVQGRFLVSSPYANGDYTGSPYTFSVTGVSNATSPYCSMPSYQVYYSSTQLNADNYTSGTTTPPTETEPGYYTKYFCVVGGNFTPYCGSGGISIYQLTPTLKANYGYGTARSNSYGTASASYSTNGDGEVSCSCSHPSFSNINCYASEGKITISYIAPNTTSYQKYYMSCNLIHAPGNHYKYSGTGFSVEVSVAT